MRLLDCGPTHSYPFELQLHSFANCEMYSGVNPRGAVSEMLNNTCMLHSVLYTDLHSKPSHFQVAYLICL